MAKDIFQTRKRVSHFQKSPKDFDGENELFVCKDFVSSIIQDMDSNFNNIQSGFSKKSIEWNETHFSTPEDSFLSIPLLQIPSSSSSNGTLQIPAKHTKNKKFSLSKKFPLMEKSQKILKQLKHNQNIPKPRAHLAGIPKSPKGKAKFMTPKVSISNKKEIQNIRNKIISNPHCKVPSNHSPVINAKNSNSSKTSKDGLAVKHSKPKSIEDKTCGKGSIKDIHTIIDSNKESNSILESDGDTSDSEYERFVKKSKKGLQKKSSKRQKQNTNKSKSCPRSLKRKKLSHVSKQNNRYDCDTVPESSKNSHIIPFKKQKVIHDDACLENDLSCSDHDVPDLPTRDSSSESDDDDSVATSTQQTISKTCEVKPVSKTAILSGAHSSQSYQSVAESNMNSDLVSSNDEIPIVNSVPLEVKHTGETEISTGANSHQSCQNLHVLESNINSVKVQNDFLNESLKNSIKIEWDSLPSNLVIDICDSDDECSNGELNASDILINENVVPTSIGNSTKSLADTDSEESDIEIIEEVKKPVQTVNKCSASLLANAPDCLKNIVTSETNLDIENVCVDVKPLIKTEDMDIKTSVNILPKVKNQNAAEIDKHDVVYRTDICHTKITFEQRTISSHCIKTENVPMKGSFQANPDLTVIKHDIGSDDDIVILDSVNSPKAVDTLNFPSAKIENIGSEPPTSESKLKLLNTIDSEPEIGETNEWGGKFEDAIPVSSTELLEWYKMEFDTYLEMKRANADVEASLKNLQARQTQKMRYVRKLLHKCVKSNQDTKSLVEPSKVSKDLISVNVQNNCDTTPNNSFSLNSQIVSALTVGQDIKPDVNKLKEEMQYVATKPKIESIQDDLNSKKCTPKIESDDKQTLKLLDEKCSECGKDAVAACQRCAKVFFCSHECGRKFWIDGHVKVCGTK